MPQPMFPVSFGQMQLVKFDDHDPRFYQLVLHLMACAHHEHNFLVQRDGCKVYLSETAVKCADGILFTHEVIPATGGPAI